MYMNPVTLLGLTVVFYYSITQIFYFYGVGEDVYGVYLMFYLFLILCTFILPSVVK